MDDRVVDRAPVVAFAGVLVAFRFDADCARLAGFAAVAAARVSVLLVGCTIDSI